jgi:hypothetical protein
VPEGAEFGGVAKGQSCKGYQVWGSACKMQRFNLVSGLLNNPIGSHYESLMLSADLGTAIARYLRL